MNSRIVVIGSINLDLVAHVPHLPHPGETIPSLSFATFSGGKGANQAFAAARLGAQVAFVGRVGTDGAGDQLKTALERGGVDVSAVKRCEGPSGTALITTAEGGENTIVIVAGANERLTADDVNWALGDTRNVGMVMAQLEVPLPVVERMAALCQERGLPFMLDPAPARALPRSLLEHVTWLTPNESESALLLDLPASHSLSAAEVAERLLAHGCRNVALKLGGRGAFLAGRDTPPAMIDAFHVEAVDTTAAGDVFNGAFASRLVSGDSIPASARYAAAAAALSVTAHGAQASMPTGEQVREFLVSSI